MPRLIGPTGKVSDTASEIQRAGAGSSETHEEGP